VDLPGRRSSVFDFAQYCKPSRGDQAWLGAHAIGTLDDRLSGNDAQARGRFCSGQDESLTREIPPLEDGLDGRAWRWSRS
jgi:hypothetical protein